MTTCDVPGCTNERIMSWRPPGHGRGYRICGVHADRHHDPQDEFDLFVVFGLSRDEPKRLSRGAFQFKQSVSAPPEDRERQAKVRHCKCGAPLPKRRRYCDACRENQEQAAKQRYEQERPGRPHRGARLAVATARSPQMPL